MTISLSEAGKRFNREWIFRNCSIVFEQGGSYAITGPNGSGKSTLLQAVAGALQLSAGAISYAFKEEALENEFAYRHISMAAPYLESIEEMTALELLHFQQTFKPFLEGVSHRNILEAVGLEKAAEKQVRYYSSGMKQRLKLALAIFADSSALLLDEPCTNLDAAGITRYQELIGRYAGNRLLIVSSNDPQEYHFCRELVSILDYKS